MLVLVLFGLLGSGRSSAQMGLNRRDERVRVQSPNRPGAAVRGCSRRLDLGHHFLQMAAHIGFVAVLGRQPLQLGQRLLKAQFLSGLAVNGANVGVVGQPISGRLGQYLLVQAGGLKLLQLGQQGGLAGLQLGLELRRFLGQLLLSRRLLVALDVGVVHAR